MIYETAFGDWEISENTALNLHDRLMWCRSPLGTVSVGSGKIVEESWDEATKKYGRGVTEYIRSDSNTLGQNVILTTPMTNYEKGYKHGNEQVMHSGYADWRMPTLEEVVNITFNQSWGAKKIKDGEDDVNIILKTIFHQSCFGLNYWTANKCWDSKDLRTFIGLKSKNGPVIWTFRMGYDVVIWDSGGEQKVEMKSILLVRKAYE